MTSVGIEIDQGVAVERDARALGVLRLLIFGIWLIDNATAALSPLAMLPQQLLEPVGVLRFLPPAAWEWLLQPRVLLAFQILLLLCTGLAAIGVRPYRPIAVLAAVLITVEQTLDRSYNFSDHPETLLVLLTYIITLAPAADRFSWPGGGKLSDRPGVYRASIAFILVVGSFTYAAAGIYRTAHHSLSMFTSSSMAYAIVQNSFRYGDGSVGAFLLEHGAVARWIQMMVPLATAFEIAAPVALLFRWFRWVWLAFLVTFHVISAFVMEVEFWQSLIVVGVGLILFDRSGGVEAE